jgi:predicted nucleic acid-binding protein
MAYLLDSDVLIDISRNRAAAIDYVDSLPDQWAISQVTSMELLVGARDKREVAYLDAFYPPILSFGLTSPSARGRIAY